MTKLRLDRVESLFIALNLVALIVYWFTNSSTFFFVTIPLLLTLNLINRRSLARNNQEQWQKLTNIQLTDIAEQIEQIKTKLNTYLVSPEIIPPQIENNNPSSAPSETIVSVQEDIQSIYKSLLTVIDFLKQEKIESRIKNLETLYEAKQSSHKGIPTSSLEVKLPSHNILTKPLDLSITAPPKIAWKCIQILVAHSDAVTDLVLSDDSQYLFTVSADNKLKLWNLDDGVQLSEIQASDCGITTITIDQDDYFNSGIITGSIDQNLKIWSLDSEQQDFVLQNSFMEHTGSIHGLAIAPSKKLLISGSFDRSVKQWDLSTGNLLYDCVNEDDEAINCLAINEQINLLATGGDSGVVTMWELGTDKQVGLLLGNETPILSIAISKSGEFIAAGCGDGSVVMWQLPTTDFSIYLEITPWREFKVQEHGQITDLVFSQDEKLLYTADAGGFVKIWRLDTYQEIGHLQISDDDRILCLSLSNNDNLLAVGGSSGTVKVWHKNEVIYEDPQ